MELKASTTHGVFWNILANSSTQFANFLVFVLLARDLPLEVFGLVIFALLVSNFFMIFIKEGVVDCLIQRPEWEEGFVSSAFWIMFILGIGLMLVSAFIVAPLLGLWFDPIVTVYLQVLSPVLFFAATSSINFGRARREFKFKLTAGRNFINGVVTAIVALILAFLDFGAWALIISRLVGAFGAAALLWFAVPVKVTPRLDSEDARAIWKYSMPIFGSRILGFSAFKAADLFLIMFLGPAALAIYRVGTRIWEAITNLLVHPIMTVAISTFSRVPRDELGKSFVGMLTVVIAIYLPVYFGAAAIGVLLTTLVFGDEWYVSGVVMTLFCLAAAPQLARALIPAALKSLDATNSFFRFTTTESISSTFWAAVTAYFGPIALGVGMFIDPFCAILVNIRILRADLGVSISGLIRSIFPFVLSSILMCLLVVAFQIATRDAMNDLVRLAACVILGMVSYPLILMVVARQATRDLLASAEIIVPKRMWFILQLANRAFGRPQAASAKEI